MYLGSNFHEEKELLKTMLNCMNVPMERFEEISCLIDIGFYASQVAFAISETNTFVADDLMNFLTEETHGSLEISKQGRQYKEVFLQK